MSVHPYLDDVGPIALAHRGGGPAGRENSAAAFEEAVRLGYRYLETDVRATADGVLLAFHDATLDRVTDHSGPIAEQTWAQVAPARIGGVDPIPRLDELVDAFPEARFNLDIKCDRAVAPLISWLERRPRLLERVCIGSFDDVRLSAIRRALGRRLCTSAGPAEVRRLRITSLTGPVGRRLPVVVDCVQVPPRHGRIPLVDA